VTFSPTCCPAPGSLRVYCRQPLSNRARSEFRVRTKPSGGGRWSEANGAAYVWRGGPYDSTSQKLCHSKGSPHQFQFNSNSRVR